VVEPGSGSKAFDAQHPIALLFHLAPHQTGAPQSLRVQSLRVGRVVLADLPERFTILQRY